MGSNRKTDSQTDSFPSSAAFDAINDALNSSDEERKDAIKKGGAIFAFTLKNESGAQESWFIDLKESGKVGKGTAPEGKKSNGESCARNSMLGAKVLICLGSAIKSQRRRLHQTHLGKGKCAEVVYERETEGQG